MIRRARKHEAPLSELLGAAVGAARTSAALRTAKAHGALPRLPSDPDRSRRPRADEGGLPPLWGDFSAQDLNRAET